MDRAARDALAPVATAIKPLLNRLVFHGIETCRALLDPTAARVRPGVHVVPTVHALATTTLERLTAELMAAGFTRILRTTESETWSDGADARMTIAAADGPESPRAVAFEYALLLTRTVETDDGCAVRVSSIPAQIALYWQAHLASQTAVTDSERIEDMIELVVRRAGIVGEVQAAPAELRALIGEAATAFAASDSCRWVLRRALPDARHTPAYVEHARLRFMELATLA